MFLTAFKPKSGTGIFNKQILIEDISVDCVYMCQIKSVSAFTRLSDQARAMTDCPRAGGRLRQGLVSSAVHDSYFCLVTKYVLNWSGKLIIGLA